MAGVTLNEFLDSSQHEHGDVNAVIVENDKDPKKLGRVKVRIRGYSDDEAGIPTEDLPWVTMLEPIGTGTGEASSLRVPAVGTKVKVKKVGGDDYTWQATSQTMTTNHNGLGWLQGDYPETWGSLDKSGTGIQSNMKKGNLLMKHSSKTDCNIDGAGAATVNVKDYLKLVTDNYADIKISDYFKVAISDYEKRDIGSYREVKVGENDKLTVNGELTITCSGGDITITSSGNIVLNASTVKVNGKLEVSGTIDANGEIKSGAIGLIGHKHEGVQSGGSKTSTSVPPAP